MAERVKRERTKAKNGAGAKAQAKAETQVPGKKEGAYLLFGLASLALAFYTLVSLVSYLFTWADDQSLLDSDGVLSTVMQVENGGGAIGLAWANFLISKMFGLGSFIIPFFFGGVALFCLKIKKVNVVRLFFLSLFGSIIMSISFSFLFSFTSLDALFGNGAGGSYGNYMTVWLKKMLGNMGATSVILLAIITWLVAANNKVVEKFNKWIDKITAPRPKKEKVVAADLKSEGENGEVSADGADGSSEGTGDIFVGDTDFEDTEAGEDEDLDGEKIDCEDDDLSGDEEFSDLGTELISFFVREAKQILVTVDFL